MPAQQGYYDTLKSVAGKIFTYLSTITLTGVDGKTLTVAESITLNALPVGGLAVATSANTLGSLAVGTTLQILVGGGAATVPAWGTDIPTAVTIGAKYIYRADGTDVPVADGGTGASTFALNGVLYGNAANAIGVTAIGAAGQILRVGASPFVPAWTTAAYPAVATTTGAYMRADGTNFIQSTLILPNTAGKGALAVATDANTWGDLAVGTAGQILRGVGAATVPAWTTATYPATVVKGDILHASDTNVITGLADVATGSYLASGGIGAAPAWATLNQAAVAGLTVASSPEFVTVKLSGLTDGYIPYHVADATGLANSAIFQSGGNVGFNTTDIEAWEGTTWGALEFGFASSLMYNKVALGSLHISNNAYFDGVWKYKKDGLACNYYQTSTGSHIFRTAASGHENNPMTDHGDWITALTIGPTGGLSLNGLTDPGVGNIHMPDESWIGPSSTAGVYFKGGNYGFGTANPQVLLDVNGNIRVENRINSIGDMHFGIDENNDDADIKNFVFWKNGIGTGSELMRIQENGNVGIGTTTPGVHLEVRSAVGVYDTIPALGAYGGSMAITGGSGIGLLIGRLDTGNVFQQVQRIDGTATAYNLLLQPNAGNVGIGTASPTVKVHLAGTGTLSNFMRVENDGGSLYAGMNNAGGTAITNGLAYSSILVTAGTNALQLGTNATGNVTILNGGNVGIGFTAPLSGLCVDSLHVGSESAAGDNNLLVDGTIQALRIGIGVEPDATNPFYVYANSANVVSRFRQNSTNGYGIVINAGGTASGRYALVIRSEDDNTDYFSVLSETGKEGNVWTKGTIHVDGVATFDAGLGVTGAHIVSFGSAYDHPSYITAHIHDGNNVGMEFYSTNNHVPVKAIEIDYTGDILIPGTFHVDGVATLDGGFKSFGAETLKVWTYTKTLIQADIDAVHANFTITAVTVANVRALNMAYVNVSLTPDMAYDYPGAYLGSLIGNNQFYIDSTTSVHVGLGTGAEVGDIISITIIEAIV